MAGAGGLGSCDNQGQSALRGFRCPAGRSPIPVLHILSFPLLFKAKPLHFNAGFHSGSLGYHLSWVPSRGSGLAPQSVYRQGRGGGVQKEGKGTHLLGLSGPSGLGIADKASRSQLAPPEASEMGMRSFPKARRGAEPR